MKKFLLFFFILLLPAISSYGEWSIALKEGYLQFDKHHKSIYVDNDIYASEFDFGGGYIRYDNDRWFLRTDIESFKTGNEFISSPGIAYEGMRLRETEVSMTLGIFLTDWFYIGGGIGEAFNRFKIVEFPEIPSISNKSDPEITYHALAGFEKSLYKNFYGFIEGRKTWQRADVTIHSENFSNHFTENLGYFGIYIGLGYRF